MNDKFLLNSLRYFIIFVISSIILIGIFFTDNKISWVLGAIFGLANAILLFFDLKRTIELAVEMDAKKAESYAFSKYMFRFLVTGIIIYISIRFKYFHVVSTVLGLTSIKMAILLKGIIFREKEGR